jgi:hypothetical protein
MSARRAHAERIGANRRIDAIIPERAESSVDGALKNRHQRSTIDAGAEVLAVSTGPAGACASTIRPRWLVKRKPGA